MSVRLRILDDGAWLSVNDRRRVSVSELWRVADATFCECDLPDVIVEGFIETGVDGRTVAVRVVGQCIACGTKAPTDWIPVGRVVDGEYRDLDRESVLAPTGVKRRSSTPDDGDAEGDPDATPVSVST